MKNLQEQIRKVLKLDEEVKKLAEDLYKKKSLLIMGRGFNFATCLEGALVRNFKIITYILLHLNFLLVESKRIDLHAQ